VRDLDFGVGNAASDIDFFSFVAIGNAAFIGAHFAQDGSVGAASGYRAAGVLKRIAVTPVSAAVFIAANTLARLVAALVATAAMLGLAEAFGADITYTANLAWMAPLVAIAVLTGVSFGFAIAGATGSPEAANQLNIGLFTPVFMLAGIMYPLAGLPDLARDAVIYVIPFAAPVDAIRGLVDGLPITEFLRQSAIAVTWLGVAFALAVRNYRFVERGS
jgi:ABC-2 type transport system permease protein